jgi:hypothetical protein
MTKEELNEMRMVAKTATPGPWGPWMGNCPFYVIVKKPAPSLSKHDDERPTYWPYNDGKFVLTFNPQAVLELLDEIERLKEIEAVYNNSSVNKGAV